MKKVDYIAILAILLLVLVVVILSIIAIKLSLPDATYKYIRPSTAKIYNLKMSKEGLIKGPLIFIDILE